MKRNGSCVSTYQRWSEVWTKPGGFLRVLLLLVFVHGRMIDSFVVRFQCRRNREDCSTRLDEAAFVLRIHQEVDDLVHVLIAETIEHRDSRIRIRSEELRSRAAEFHLCQMHTNTDYQIISNKSRVPCAFVYLERHRQTASKRPSCPLKGSPISKDRI
jgi:hypothetical protein